MNTYERLDDTLVNFLKFFCVQKPQALEALPLALRIAHKDNFVKAIQLQLLKCVKTDPKTGYKLYVLTEQGREGCF